MITPDLLESTSIDKFLNLINSAEIPLLDAIKIDNTLYGRIDILINRYYAGDMKYLKLLMAFNKITDPIEIQLGMIFEIPDFSSLLAQLEINDILDSDIIPGINKTTNSNIINQENIVSKNSAVKTTALPKLNITLKKVSYNDSLGIITY